MISMFTLQVPGMGERFRVVLATRADGFVLVADDTEPLPILRWINPEGCTLGSRFMNAEQKDWWRNMGTPSH